MTTISPVASDTSGNWAQVAAELGKRVPVDTNGGIPGDVGTAPPLSQPNGLADMPLSDLAQPGVASGATVRVFWWGFHVELDHDTLEYVLDAGDTVNGFVDSVGGSIPSPAQPWIVVIAKFVAGAHALLRSIDRGYGIYISMSWFAPGVFVPTPVTGPAGAEMAVPPASSESVTERGVALATRGEPVSEPVPFWVNESDRDVDTGLYIQPGQRVIFSADGEIWAGVLFTGRNGPEGWAGWSASQNSPLPYAAPFSLLAKLGGRYLPIGRGKEFVYTGRPSKLFLRINDDTPGNGWGAFEGHVEVYSS